MANEKEGKGKSRIGKEKKVSSQPGPRKETRLMTQEDAPSAGETERENKENKERPRLERAKETKVMTREEVFSAVKKEFKSSSDPIPLGPPPPAPIEQKTVIPQTKPLMIPQTKTPVITLTPAPALPRFEATRSERPRSEMRRLRKVSPLGMRVLVKIRRDGNQTDTGLYLPEGAKELSQESLLGEVIEVASALDDDTKEEANISGVPQGALVLIPKHAGTKVPWDEDLRVVDTKEILALVHETTVN